ncbi:hypothetical protein NOK12_20730 [Nocardioides sp. OK12]|uniref:hypothetical protein n=1 Tax=Nocardioides sp. OK12 TaxID=2758661 RepID=UPI0021C3896B|nr:hypothetical protein [Nocardioides sp. OK12]GHJ59555.1 hypothetical protein NOK12_20730 [Nocardioides sp. OK12]
MDADRLRCAEQALRSVPEDYRQVDGTEVASRERGQSRHRGMYIGWVWGQDGQGRHFLDLLSDHRHPGMLATRYFTSGDTEPIEVPASMRAASADPVEDAELERRYFARNRAAYADLRERGLLPPEPGASPTSSEPSY